MIEAKVMIDLLPNNAAPVVDLARFDQALERYAAAVEKLTREHPADWLWNYRRWKVQRDAEGNPVVVKSGELPGPG